jgi:uncharacterized protein HemX
MADNDKKTELDMENNQVMETLAEETKEEISENLNKPEITEKQQAETIVIKKGGFLAFFSFVLSLVAIAASAYLYLQYQKPNQQDPVTIDVNQWKKPLADLDSKLINNINQLKSQMTQSQQQNQALSAQLQQIKNELSQSKPLELTSESTQALFDEDSFTKKIEDIEAQINQNKQLYESVSAEVSKSNNSQKQELTKLQTLFANQPAKPTVIQPEKRDPNEFKFEMAENLLQAAIIQLDVHKNLNQTNKLLDEASAQVKQIPGQTFANFAFEIEQTMQTLAKIDLVDAEKVAKQISGLKSQVSSLSFESPKVEEQNESSWFDKLVVIRKIDEDSTQKLTAAEQMVIYSQLNNAFDMLNFALLSQNQSKWNASIAQINDLLAKYFANNSIEIQNQLSSLSELQLNPEYPSISSLLTSFKQYRNNQ